MFTSLLLLLSLLCPHFFQEEKTVPETQSQESSDQEGFRIGVAVNQVFLSVNARSVSGGFVKDLTKDDFRIFENGQLQEIVNFYAQQVPVKVVLLIDASGSTAQNQVDIRRAALEFVKRLGPEDEVSVITFNHDPRLILSWSNDLKRIETALQSIYAKGNTVLNDALYVTFDDLLRNVEGKTAVILLTDGIDTGSMVGFKEAVDLAVRSDSMVYVVSKLEEYWSSAVAYRQQATARGIFVPKHLTDDYILEMKKGLQQLAQLSGGKVLDAKSFSSLTDVYAQVADELKNQFYISYIPTNPKKDGTWRTLEVEVPRGGVVVSTRSGYYAE